MSLCQKRRALQSDANVGKELQYGKTAHLRSLHLLPFHLGLARSTQAP
jgi:hypothetical protein